MKSFKMGQWPIWKKYREAILGRFGKQPFDDFLSELMQLRQTGSVEEYKNSFDALSIRIEDLPVGHALSCFLSGLNSEIQNTVRMFKAQTLHDAYCLAKLQEATLVSIARRKPILEKPVHPQHPKPIYSATSSQLTNHISDLHYLHITLNLPHKVVPVQDSRTCQILDCTRAP